MKKCKSIALPRDGEGRAIITMTVKDDSDFLSVYSEGQTPVISAEVAEFIESRTETLPPKMPLALHIHRSCIDDGEKELYRRAIRKYYEEKSIANDRRLRRNQIIAAMLAIAGVLVLAAAIALGETELHPVLSGVIDIVAWVLLWEATDVSLFRNHEARTLRRRYRQYMEMRIEYFKKS